MAVHRLLREHSGRIVEVVSILVRNRVCASLETPQEEALFVDSFDALLLSRPDLVVECAGHQALDEYGVAVLQAHVDLLMVSVGALANSERERALISAAYGAGRKLILPSGAIGGIDWLAAARTAGLRQVTYRSRKPPEAWISSTSEQHRSPVNLDSATRLFQGSAREAALQYPRNANVAALIALAALGFDATQVELFADPMVASNIHEIEAVGDGGRMTLRIEGVPDMRNPKSSVMTAHSVVRAILNRGSNVLM